MAIGMDWTRVAGAAGEGAQITDLESAGGATTVTILGLNMQKLALFFLLVPLAGCAHVREAYDRTCDQVYDLGVVLDENVKGEAAEAVKPAYDELFELCFREP